MPALSGLAVFDALFCYGEEPDCWFNPGGLAAMLGCDRSQFEKVCARLQAKGKMSVSYLARDHAHARQVGMPVLKRSEVPGDNT